jgi:hypothetical protein
MRRRGASLIFVWCGLACGLGTGAAATARGQTRQDILDYKLTLARANQLVTALDAMTRYVVSLPDFQDRVAKSMRMTPAEQRVQLEKDPKAMAILQQNNLTAVEYLVGVPALRMALMAAQGAAGAPNLTVSPANLAFARANLAQLKPRMDAVDGIRPPEQFPSRST